jgi:hypothetical protein
MGLVVKSEDVRFLGRLPPGGRLRRDAVARTWHDDGILLDEMAADRLDRRQVFLSAERRGKST